MPPFILALILATTLPAADGRPDSHPLTTSNASQAQENSSSAIVSASPWKRFESKGIEMAVPVRIVLYASDETVVRTASRAALARFRQLNAVMSDYDPTSEVRRLSATAGAGQAVKVGDLVDPRTGMGLTDHSSVTVIAPDTITDGLASAVSVLGPTEGLKLIDATQGTATLIVRSPNGKTETYRSARWADFREVEPGELPP